MTQAFVEHANITVSDPDATARWLCNVFGWSVRWRGPAIHGGTTVHVGGNNSYLALYNIGHALPLITDDNRHRQGGLNHIGIVVDEIAALEAKVKAVGFTPHSHADYEPGKRFYFNDHDGIEFEVISYA